MAQTGITGFDVRLVRPASDDAGFLNVHGARLLAPRQFSFGTIFDYAHGLLAATNATSMPVRVVNDLSTANLAGAYGATDFLELGLLVPVVFYEHGANVQTGASFTTASLGDLAFDIKFRLLEKKPVNLALLVRPTLPTGSPSRATGYNAPTIEGKLIIDKTVGPVTGAVNIGARSIERTPSSIDIDDLFNFATGIVFTLPFGDRSLDALIELDGFTILGSSSRLATPVEGLFGVRKRWKSRWAAEAAGGTGITGGVGAGEWRLVLSVRYTPEPLKERPVMERKKQKKEKHEPPAHFEQIASIPFAFGKDLFLRVHHATLDDVIEKLKEQSSAAVKVVGHADSEGEEWFNEDLSYRRAENVKAYLVEHGIAPDRITTEGKGSREPIADNRWKEGKAKNRRVEIQ